MANPNKQYGLLFPNKNRGHQIGQVTAKPSIFEEDSDSDTPVSKPTGISMGVKKQDQLNQEKAIGEDPTVYHYDEIYDEMDQKRKESKLSRQDLDRKPKYINRLLAAAEKRKRENERRIERQVQKEREEEGETFKDKESFITSAYKKKLEEMKELEAQEKREEYLESIGDVRKQGNLDGFYRHLYDQKVNYEDKKDEDKHVDIKAEPESDPENKEQKSDSDEGSSPKKRRTSIGKLSDNDKSKKEIKNRKYRIRRHSEESDKSDDEVEIKKEHLPSNLDADSDFSIDSSDSEDEGASKKKNKLEKPSKEEKDDKKNGKQDQEAQLEPVKTEETEKEESKPLLEVKPKKPKVDIWKKVTVGEKYDEAVKRYFERKALREMQGISF